jgi:hypothetical protein
MRAHSLSVFRQLLSVWGSFKRKRKCILSEVNGEGVSLRFFGTGHECYGNWYHLESNQYAEFEAAEIASLTES